jgi:hypothetical protein
MSLIYRSQVTRCWEVTHINLPHQHFFAFGLTSDPDSVTEYGIISASPSQGVKVDSKAVDIQTHAPDIQKRPLPRSICRLILTGKPLVASVLKLQAKRSKLQTQWNASATRVTGEQSALDQHLYQELWFIDDYLDRLYTAIAHLYDQVVLETELIQFDATTIDEDRLEAADLRAEHVERLLDSFESQKSKGKRKQWFVTKMLHRYL